MSRLISSLQGKAFRMLDESRGSAERINMYSQGYQKTLTWYFIYQFILQTGNYDLIMDFYAISTSLVAFKKCNVTLT